jgi:hypothetical protein
MTVHRFGNLGQRRLRVSDKNYVAICSNCGRSLEICRDNFPDELKYENQVVGKWVKRKPLPDGRLELTREELMELRWMVDINIDEVVFKMDKLWIIPCGQLENVKAILYLANLFDLTGEK